MAEIGIDISHQESKTLEQYLQDDFDEVITVCDDANEACPIFPNAEQRRHWSFLDPSKTQGSDAEQLQVYRAVRDAIQQKIEEELLDKTAVSHSRIDR
jgi:arsenate reductase